MHKKKNPGNSLSCRGIFVLAERTGLEPATSDVTGRHSNQLNYHSQKYSYYYLNTAAPVVLSNIQVFVTTPNSVSLQHPSKLCQL